MNIEELNKFLSKYGLIIRGGFNAVDDLDLPELNDSGAAKALLLIGYGGSSLWSYFSESSEYLDGEDHALDRWSRRVAAEVESGFGGRAVFPFTSSPYHPFLSWAQRAEDAQPSRLGLSIHPRFGVWHAYRFALLSPTAITQFDNGLEQTGSTSRLSTFCLNCTDAPCLNACPVNAYNNQDYEVQICADHLKARPATTCHTGGCLARRACPVGTEHQYEPAQAAFHMQAFIQARQTID